MKRAIKIVDSYKIWDIRTMKQHIEQECFNYLIEKEKIDMPIVAAMVCTVSANRVLNRSYFGLYLEWYLHNIGYYLTLPFIKNERIKALNLRFKDVDLEEH